MTRRRVHIMLLTVMACLSMGVFLIAAGTVPEGDTEADDSEDIALLKGISADEAKALYGWQADLSALLTGIFEDFPDDYATSAFPDDGTAVVGFAGAVPSGAQALLDDFSSEHGVTIYVHDNIGYSLSQMKSALRSVHSAVSDTPNVKQAVTVVSDRTIWSEVNYAGTPSDEVLAVIEANADAALADHPAGITTKVTFWSGDGDSMIHFRNQVVQHVGGEPLRTCTSAFTVRPQTGGGNESEDHGILTAAHCSNTQNDDGVNLVVQDEEFGNNGDMQWMKGNQTYPDDFFAGSANETETNRRDVAAVGLSSSNYVVCRNGKTTHKECMHILYADVCVEFADDTELCGMTVTKTDDSEGGDSGGPVYRNNNAHGIFSGTITMGGVDRGLYTQAIEVRDAFTSGHKVYLKH